ncbi:MAG: hypothetical protein H6721_33245 [Sandaracinus sp.]|nr:hypothetical protein [Sandaracinus sp.]
MAHAPPRAPTSSHTAPKSSRGPKQPSNDVSPTHDASAPSSSANHCRHETSARASPRRRSPTPFATRSTPKAIEGVDCSEHPCIAYGRLRGDEEDVEELERSSALDAYRDDRLVLLLWATTASETSEGAPESTPETAIFALAFLPATDDTDPHETVERRIRARVFEVWNADRPDREALEPPAI